MPFLSASCAHVRSEALRTVKVPMEVVGLLADLRAFLQETCEPPVYVSDRRLVKALQLLQVQQALALYQQGTCAACRQARCGTCAQVPLCMLDQAVAVLAQL